MKPTNDQNFSDPQKRPSKPQRSHEKSSQEPAVNTPQDCDSLLMIEESHRRSSTYGLAENEKPDFSQLNRADLSHLIEENRLL
ncbi:MAG: hypothetical protein WA632_12780, partial [Gallionella sp.]